MISVGTLEITSVILRTFPPPAVRRLPRPGYVCPPHPLGPTRPTARTSSPSAPLLLPSPNRQNRGERMPGRLSMRRKRKTEVTLNCDCPNYIMTAGY